MRSETKLAGIPCNQCGWQLLVTGEKVYCQNPDCKNRDGTLKQVRPNEI